MLLKLLCDAWVLFLAGTQRCVEYSPCFITRHLYISPAECILFTLPVRPQTTEQCARVHSWGELLLDLPPLNSRSTPSTTGPFGYKFLKFRASEQDPQLKVLLSKSDDQSLIPGNFMKVSDTEAVCISNLARL